MSKAKMVLDLYKLVKEARRMVTEAYGLSQEVEPDGWRNPNHPEHLIGLAETVLNEAEKSTGDWAAAVAGSKALIEEER